MSNFRLSNSSVRFDTSTVLDRAYLAQDLRDGAYGVDSPIFDNLAAERFGR